MAGPGRVLFNLRLLQMQRAPAHYFLAWAGVFLALFSTRLAPLPPLEGGRIWADFFLSGLQAWFFLFSLGAALRPEGLLPGRLPLLPGDESAAKFAWALAACTSMLLFCLLGWLLLPRGWGLPFFPSLLVLVLQGACLVSLGGFLRPVLGRGGTTAGLVGAWVLFSLPPLSWADPKVFAASPAGLHGGSLGGAVLLWGGLWWLFTLFRPMGRGLSVEGWRGVA